MAFLAGWRVYALVALVAVIGGLGIAVAYYKNSAARAEAEAALVRDQRDRAIEAVKASEAANQKLKELNNALDAALVERDKRAKELERAKRNLTNEINSLKESLAEEDRRCLDRDLPDALLERLRIDPGHPDPR